jgi:hypothetical protein
MQYLLISNIFLHSGEACFCGVVRAVFVGFVQVLGLRFMFIPLSDVEDEAGISRFFIPTLYTNITGVKCLSIIGTEG